VVWLLALSTKLDADVRAELPPALLLLFIPALLVLLYLKKLFAHWKLFEPNGKKFATA
jgi:hypothetical protein